MEESASSRRFRYIRQYFIALAASICYFSMGMTVTWPNVLVSHLLKDNTTIFGNSIHMEEVYLDMASSMMFIGSMPGFLISGWLVGLIGRRWSIFVGVLPSITGALLIGFAYNSPMIIIGRFLDGVTFGMMNVAVRSYIVEISDNEVRGRASCIVNLTMQIGSILSVGLGILMTWYYVALLYGGILVIHCALVIIFLPESPTYLAVMNRDDRALKLLAKLRGPSVDPALELKRLKDENQRNDGGSGFRALLKKAMLGKMFMLFGLFLICNFAGVQVLKANVSRLLTAFGLPLEKDVGAVLVICILFCGSFTMMCVLDVIGRRRVLILSLALIATAYSILGTYVYLVEQRPKMLNIDVLAVPCETCNSTSVFNSSFPNSSLSNSSLSNSSLSNSYISGEQTRLDTEIGWSWVPLVCIMLAAFGQSAGAGPLPFMLAPEYFPTSMRSQGTSICQLMGSLQSFATLQLFSLMQSCLTQAGLFWTYGAFAAVGIFYTYFIIQETKGKRVG